VEFLAMTTLEATLENWLRKRRRERALRRFGGLQTCCWCKQCAQDGDGWNFQPWGRDKFLDVLTCGVCGGTSLWRFEIGMMWIGPLSPPESKWPAVHYYDIPRASLVGASRDA
jgi:hypothetical protein